MKTKEKLINTLSFLETNLLKDGRILAGIVTATLIIFSLIALTEEKVEAGYNMPKTMTGTLTTQINWYGEAKLIKVYGPQLEEMKRRGYSNTRILDLLAIKSQECNNYDSCVGLNGVDVGPFQINQIHREQYLHSYELHNKKQFGELFLYQLDYANGLVESYQDRFCSASIFNQIGRKYTNERRAKCTFVSYNGSPRYKHAYAEIVWLKRQAISNYLFDNGFLIN